MFNKVFVFGSNKSGIHGAGAAKYAHENLGAEMGIGEGPTGLCYALPTKGYRIEKISLEEIQKSVDTFIEFAKDVPQNDFKVTKVGCGLGGYRNQDIAPMFKDAPDNCYFDEDWKPWLGPNRKYWGSM
jgi:hypothetical protein